ncbi:MAG: hypothetical protein EB032_12555, partial [Betaproteobacteria bacterium]|nr:hypothetical protein [Betaproteobacteria bacterium]
MKHSSSRRTFFKTSGAISASTLLGSTALVAYGNNSSPGLTSDEQMALTATQALAALMSGRLSATTYVSTLIARAKAVSDLNAMITLDEAGAMATAKKIDADRTAGKTLGVLAGLPIVVKDNINTKGLKTTGGTYSLRNFQPATNAPSLQKLIDAGAIVLGKSNLHEWAFGITSTNFTLGIDPVTKAATRPCKNPYDTTRVSGGSSGGTAVAVASRFVPAGLGTDTGGSTREPASFCGIAGFRPSVGDGAGKGRRYADTVNDALPISTTRDTLGPMARTVADVALLDAVITSAAESGLDEACIGMPHRGRLNVLANVAGKSFGQIFQEFEGNYAENEVHGSGDVKYHLGTEGVFQAESGATTKIYLAANPSHLEAVNPVLEGIVR